jgi:hypothetical protein
VFRVIESNILIITQCHESERLGLRLRYSARRESDRDRHVVPGNRNWKESRSESRVTVTSQVSESEKHLTAA